MKGVVQGCVGTITLAAIAATTPAFADAIRPAGTPGSEPVKPTDRRSRVAEGPRLRRRCLARPASVAPRREPAWDRWWVAIGLDVNSLLQPSGIVEVGRGLGPLAAVSVGARRIGRVPLRLFDLTPDQEPPPPPGHRGFARLKMRAGIPQRHGGVAVEGSYGSFLDPLGFERETLWRKALGVGGEAYYEEHRANDMFFRVSVQSGLLISGRCAEEDCFSPARWFTVGGAVGMLL